MRVQRASAHHIWKPNPKHGGLEMLSFAFAALGDVHPGTGTEARVDTRTYRYIYSRIVLIDVAT